MCNIIKDTMARNKKQKFEELRNLKNVFEWNKEDSKEKIINLLNNHSNIVLELGCGKGEYTVALAKKYPNTLFVGIDIQGERIWSGAKYALENNSDNVCFFRMRIENLLEYIPKNSIDEIWITFPDPFPKDRDSRKRLTSPKFLEMYKDILKKDGIVHLKTDSKELYNYTLGMIQDIGFRLEKSIEDVYEGGDIENITDIQTTFETKHLEDGKTIRYLQIKINEVCS